MEFVKDGRVAVPERASIVNWFPESFSAHLPRHKPGLVFAASCLTVSFAYDLFCVGCRGPDCGFGRRRSFDFRLHP